MGASGECREESYERQECPTRLPVPARSSSPSTLGTAFPRRLHAHSDHAHSALTSSHLSGRQAGRHSPPSLPATSSHTKPLQRAPRVVGKLL